MENIIERLIRTGKTTTEIQSKIIGFPNIVTTEYLKEIGFEEIKAIKLKWLLKKNDRKEDEEEKAAEARRELLEEKSYIFSANANPRYILMDTCILATEKGIELIEKSSRVIVLKSTLEEIEKVMRKEKHNKNKTFFNSLIEYKNKIMLEEKYKKVFDNEKEKYVDDRILNYLNNIPEEDRPTLATADINLANRAESQGLEYILVTNRKSKKKNSQNSLESMEEEKTTIDILEVNVKVKNKKVFIKKKNPNVKAFWIKDSRIELIKVQDEKDTTQFDYIILMLRLKGNREVRVVKLLIVGNGLKYEKENVKVLNEIYKINMPEKIQEIARELFMD